MRVSPQPNPSYTVIFGTIKNGKLSRMTIDNWEPFEHICQSKSVPFAVFLRWDMRPIAVVPQKPSHDTKQSPHHPMNNVIS
jgi:hypothetical protein